MDTTILFILVGLSLDFYINKALDLDLYMLNNDIRKVIRRRKSKKDI